MSFLGKLCVTGGKESWQIQKDGCINSEVEAPRLTALRYSMKLGVERVGEKKEVKGIGFFTAAFDHHLLKQQRIGCVRKKPLNHSNNILSG